MKNLLLAFVLCYVTFLTWDAAAQKKAPAGIGKSKKEYLFFSERLSLEEKDSEILNRIIAVREEIKKLFELGRVFKV